MIAIAPTAPSGPTRAAIETILGHREEDLRQSR
jgi:hypothetical protein